MKKIIFGIIGLIASFGILIYLASCGTTKDTKLGMSKDDVLDLYDEAPTYEKDNTIYWCDNDFIKLFDSYDCTLNSDYTKNYELITNAINSNSNLRDSLNNLKFKYKFARFDSNQKLIEFYYDFNHKFNLNDDYQAFSKKDVKSLKLSKTRLDYFVKEEGQWKNNKNKINLQIELVDFDNITYEVEFDDGTLYKNYLKNNLETGVLSDFQVNKNTKFFDMLMYVDDISSITNKNDDFFNLDNFKKVAYKYAGKYVNDFEATFDNNVEKLINGKCVGYLGKLEDGKAPIYRWDTDISYLPDYANKDEFLGEMTEKISGSVKYLGHKLNPYYKVIGVTDDSKASYTINEKTNVIASNSLSNLKKCYQINIPANVTTIEDNAIINNPNLTSIVLHSGITKIGTNFLKNCPKLLEIANEGNEVLTTQMVENIINGKLFYYDSIDEFRLGSAISLYNDFIVANLNGRKDFYGNEFEGYYIVGYIGNQTNNLVLPSSISVSGRFYDNYNIFNNAFINSNIESIEIPANVKTINEAAFKNCSNLTTVKANGVTFIDNEAFMGSTNLENIEFNSLTSIGTNVFSGCSSLGEVNLPKLEYVSTSAFSECNNLTKFNAKLVTSVSDSAFYNCVKLSDLNLAPLYNVGSYAFYNCKKVEEIELSDYLDYVGNNAFLGCDSLLYYIDGNNYYLKSANNNYVYLHKINNNANEVVISNDTRYTNPLAFENINITKLTVNDNISFDNLRQILSYLDNLTYVEKNNGYYISSNSNPYFALAKYDINATQCQVQSNVSFIMDMAFAGTKITDINIPNNVTLGNNLFEECNYLDNLSIDRYYGDYAFKSCKGLKEVSIGNYFANGIFEGCINLEKVILTDTANNITSNAFSGCVKLTNIDFTKIQSIESNAFYNCIKLSGNIDLSNVTYIGSLAFYGAKEITSVKLSENLTNIGYQAFSGCTNLEEFVIPSNSAYLDSDILANCQKIAYVMLPGELFKFIENAFGSIASTADIYLDGEFDVSKLSDISLSYLELNQNIYIFSEERPTDLKYRYWHYDNGLITKWQ